MFKDRTFVVFLLLPSLIVIGFIYGCIGWNIIISISDWEGIFPTYKIVGLRQYANLLDDPVFWVSLKNNLLMSFIFVLSSLLVGLFLAILLDQNIRGEKAFRTIYLMPFAVPFVATACMWAWMYAPRMGVINSLLKEVGLGFFRSRWITDPSIALYCIIIALVWQFAGYAALIFLAGIRSIPESQIEAAKVDGASEFELYKNIIVPQLRASVISIFVIFTLFALKAFDFIWVLNQGGPGIATFVLPVMMYEYAFGMSKFAQGGALGNIGLLLAAVLLAPYLYRFYSRG